MTEPRTSLRIAALVPVRGLEGAKSRLGEALDAEERRGLVERLLRATLAAAAGVPEITCIGVVSPDPGVLAIAATLGADGLADPAGGPNAAGLADPGRGLNAALESGVPWAIAALADAMLVLPGDLPGVTPAALDSVIALASLAAAPTDGAGFVILVPDRAGSGTNLLLVSPPGAIPFRFGDGSREAHAAAARAAGLPFMEVAGPLTLDLDTPDDLLAAEEAGLVSMLRQAAT